MSDYTKIEDTKQLSRPNYHIPELIEEIVRIKIKVDDVAADLTSEKIAEKVGVSRPAIDYHIKRIRKENHVK
jgi:predicted transcriptional regulator